MISDCEMLERIERKLDRLMSVLQPVPLNERTDLLTLSEFVRMAHQEGRGITLAGLRSQIALYPDLQTAACKRSAKGKSKPQWLICPADYFRFVGLLAEKRAAK